MEFRNITLPKTGLTETDATGNREDMEGMILERIYLFEELLHTVNTLLRCFLEVRLDQGWSSELTKIRGWIANTPQYIAS
jgi:recombination associated protein RdgC